MKHIKPLTRPVRPHNAPARSTEHGRPAHRSSGVTRRATALNDALPRFGEEEWASVVVYRALRRIAAGSVPAWCRDDAIQRAALRLTTASLPRLATPDKARAFLRTTLKRAFYDLRDKGRREISSPDPTASLEHDGHQRQLPTRGPDEVIASKERWALFLRLVESTAAELRSDAGEELRRLVLALMRRRFGLTAPRAEKTTASASHQRWCRARQRLRRTLKGWVEADRLTLDESNTLDELIGLVRSA